MNVKKEVQPSTADISKTDVTTRVAEGYDIPQHMQQIRKGF